MGIRWSAIDFENKTITINHKVVTATNENENSKTKTKTITKRKTKNKSSYRTLPLFKEIEELLLYTRKMQEYYMSIFKESYNKQFKDFVCVDEMGNLRKPDYVSHKFKEILKKNGLRKNKISRFKTQLCYITFEKRNIFKRNTRLVRTFKF